MQDSSVRKIDHEARERKVKANVDETYFLKQQSKPDDVVFASPATSRLIPALSGNTTVWGHWAMSVDADERRKWLGNLFSNVDDSNRSQQFWSNDIEFIFANGALKQWLEQSPFGWGAILRDARKVFENRSVVIYQRPSTS